MCGKSKIVLDLLFVKYCCKIHCGLIFLKSACVQVLAFDILVVKYCKIFCILLDT